MIWQEYQEEYARDEFEVAKKLGAQIVSFWYYESLPTALGFRVYRV